MTTGTTSAYAPDALHTLRDSFELHLGASRAAKTTRIYLAALDALIAHLEAHGMPTGARGVKREHVESYIARRRDEVKPATLSLEFRALQQFWKWTLEEDEVDRSPMERMKAPRVPEAPVPVISTADFRKLLKTTEGRDYIDRRDAAILLLMFDTGVRRGEVAGLRVEDVDLRGRLAYVTGKGGHTRAVRFGAKTAVALDRYLRLRRGTPTCDIRRILARPRRTPDRLRVRPDHRQALRRGGPPAAYTLTSFGTRSPMSTSRMAARKAISNGWLAGARRRC